MSLLAAADVLYDEQCQIVPINRRASAGNARRNLRSCRRALAMMAAIVSGSEVRRAL